MAKRDHQFSRPDALTLQITPLGAAIVEALPNRKLKRLIECRFKTHSECPASMIFSAAEVVEFYKNIGQKIKATGSSGVKAQVQS